MFADDTNLLYSHKNIKILFKYANDELEKNPQWFKVNLLSLNVGKTKFTLFLKPRDKDNLPLQLPNLKINNQKVKRSLSIKFLGVFVVENLTCVDYDYFRLYFSLQDDMFYLFFYEKNVNTLFFSLINVENCEHGFF